MSDATIEAARADLDVALTILRRGLKRQRGPSMRELARMEGLLTAAAWALKDTTDAPPPERKPGINH